MIFLRARLSVWISCIFLLVSVWDCPAADLMDDYLSIPGSYVFVRRVPEGAQPDRLTITVFEDFMCPACYHAATDLFPSLKNKYRDKVDIRFLGFPFIHQESRLAARASVIAHELGFGEAMQKALFHAHFEQQIDITSKEGLAKVADSIGLAPELLLAQLDGDGGNAELAQTFTRAKEYQIEGTPTAILDGWIKVTNLAPDNLEPIIDGVLSKKKLTAEQSATARKKATP